MRRQRPLVVLALSLVALPFAMRAIGMTESLGTEIALFALVGLGFNLLLGCVAVALASTFAVVQISRSTVSLEAGGPPAAAAAVAAAAGPHGIVLADDEHADWLLWTEPSLAGRVAYDVRFELFNGPELQQIVSLRHASRASWRRCGATASVITFAHPADERQIVQQGVLAPGARAIVRSPRFSAVAQRPRRLGSCSL